MTKTKRNLLLFGGIGLGLALLVLVLILLLTPEKNPPADTVPTAATRPPVLETVTEIVQPPPEKSQFVPMDFGYDGDYLTCLTAPSIRGIDVSRYQKDVDWEQVRAAGFEFAIIRVGYRGYDEGQLYPDKYAQANYKGAKAAGVKVGCYFFSQAVTPEEAAEEARYVMEQIQDWELDMPVVYDWEYLGEQYRTAHVDARQLTDCTKAFCDTVEEAGYTAMVYFNPSQSHKKMYLEELTDYRFWLAMYSDQMNYPFKVDMWQYTNEGRVPGIDGNVDINLYFPYEE